MCSEILRAFEQGLSLHFMNSVGSLVISDLKLPLSLEFRDIPIEEAGAVKLPHPNVYKASRNLGMIQGI